MMDKNDEEQIRLIAAEIKRSYDHPDKALQAEVERLRGYEKALVSAFPVNRTMRGDGPGPMAQTIIDERDELKAELAEAMDHLVGVVNQACFSQDGDLDSMGTSAYADAMLYLAKRGKIELDGDPVGRRVIGKWKEK